MPSAVYDSAAPFISARIISGPGKDPVSLWTNSFKKAQSDSVGMPSLACMTELTVELNLSYVPKIQVTLQPSYRQALQLMDIDNDTITWGQAVIEVQFGYMGPEGPVLSDVFEGLLMKPEIQMGADVSISLTGIGAAAYSAMGQGSGGSVTATRSELVERFLKGTGNLSHKRNIEVDFSEIAVGSPEWLQLYGEKITVTPGFRSDWVVASMILRQTTCWWLYVGNKLKVFPINKAVEAAPKFEFQMFPQANIGSRSQSVNSDAESAPVFPILGFTSPSTQIFLPGAALRQENGKLMKGINSGSGETFAQWVGDTAVKPSRNSEATAGPEPSENTPAPSTDKPDEASAGVDTSNTDNPEDPHNVGRVANEYVRGLGALGLRVEIETQGMPNLLPGDAILVSGVGTRLSGHYNVFEVVHTLGSSGYSTSLVAYSNTAKILADLQQARGQVGNKPPTANSSSTTMQNHDGT